MKGVTGTMKALRRHGERDSAMNGGRMSQALLQETRPTLRAWTDAYDSIEEAYVRDLREQGVTLAAYGCHEWDILQIKERLRFKGALSCNGGASFSVNGLSSACRACTGDGGSKTFFLSLQCNRSCYFCFNVNQGDYDERCELNRDWKQEVDAFVESCETVSHIGLTGGEPLLHKEETLAFLSYVRDCCPQAHMRLYTAGDFLDEACLQDLATAGLSELRLSIKLDDDPVETVLARLALAKRYIPDVMVEMPVIPGTGAQMHHLLREFDALGIFGINLLEFCYPMNDWAEFEKRGFAVKNPPFKVLYDYGYAGGVPIAGSELLCLELLEFAIDEGLSLGVHYCSVDNKNKDQILRQNAAYRLDPRIYRLDEADFFYKTVKVFDGDVPLVQETLLAGGIKDFILEEEGRCLSFHSDHLTMTERLPAVLLLSYSIVEHEGKNAIMRELKLDPIERRFSVANEKDWSVQAAVYEIIALTFTYPGDVLAEAVSSGEWAEAVREIAETLGLDVSPAELETLELYEEDGKEKTLEALRIEATRLFVGTPKPLVSPFEGIWRATDDRLQPLLFVNPHSMAVERFVKSCGFGQVEGKNEPFDHVAIEFEFLQHLSMLEALMMQVEPRIDPPEDGWAGAHDRFLSEHVCAWIPRFAEKTTQESREPFFIVAAKFLDAVAKQACSA